MKIAIDARLIHETGVGRYIRNLIAKLSVYDSKNSYVIFLTKQSFDTFILPNERWSKKLADVHWHTINEQIIMPWLLYKEHVDLVHIPYFNVPILYPGTFIVTMHDLTILHHSTGKASMLPYWKYLLRNIGYRFVLWVSVHRAKKILTVSKTVKKDILSNFSIPSTKIDVTYEGIDDSFLQHIPLSKYRKPQNKYFFYVGNVYPHKNIEILLEAFSLFAKRVHEKISLILVGPDDYFYARLSLLITSLEMDNIVEIRHGVNDAELSMLYSNAIALVFPSRMEGFGLPALEALSHSCNVIASDIPIFHEVLEEYARYADTTNAESLSRVMNEVYTEQSNMIDKRKQLVQFLSKYSWDTMAKQTYSAYIQTV